jgi:AcrR family transcriptional regulator
MPAPQKSTAKAASRAKAAVERGAKVAQPLAAHEPRVVRKKRESRGRLLDAAFRLMAERGLDGVAIHEITEAADVATGGFYNHFKSKEDIYLAVTRRVFEDFGDALDGLVANLDDPAEVVAVCIRHTVLRARREPLWSQLLVREGLSAQAENRGLGKRLRRDIALGIDRGRFKTSDPVMAFVATGGAVLAALSAQLHTLKAQADLGQRIAAVALQILGLTASQAERIANKPLPDA